MLNDTFQKRFQELQGKSDSLPLQVVRSQRVGSYFLPEGSWQGWATSCQNLLKAVYGENSPHYTNFTESLKRCRGSQGDVQALQGMFKSAKEDFEGGYVFNVDLKISGEVFGNFVALAKQALAEGYRDVAAVLATAALEDALKRYANANGLSTDKRTMADVINALKSKRLVSGAQKTLLDAMPRVRNSAMHAEWEKISEPDVNGIIGFVEQFLLTHFS